MKARTLNFASPVGLIILLVCAVGLILALGAVGFRFDPFDSLQKRADRAEASAAAANTDAAARRIESAGAADTVRRIDRITVQIRAADAIAHQSALSAQDAPDAKHPVDPARLARLRHADQQLCDLRPGICPDVAAPARHADPGDAALHPSPPA
ncbi:hypothetical protein JIX58_03405 [Brevundimonas diminuta]|uniref:hypothetical protein n=1 Tax=Brevundimonas diminuta TaxID=293 RepID=UPI0019081EE8|nr:hypothetical protein [Brevundimonas diminuta]MBK1970816.1 hypothetical protein [Brevundimonas diminuta]MBK1974792.1 hypothetical protein [Brevundimonas diminuta]